MTDDLNIWIRLARRQLLIEKWMDIGLAVIAWAILITLVVSILHIAK